MLQQMKGCLPSTKDWDSKETWPGSRSRKVSRGVRMLGKLAILKLKGTPRQIGYAHGEQAQDTIRHNLEVYFRRFKNETKLSKDEALRRAEKYLRVIRRTSPSYAKNMEGVAMGSKTKLSEFT